MTRPRSSLIALDTTPYYHCISRCVRRAFLFGKDGKGRCFDHRKQWLLERIKLLSEVFAIDIAAYAVMSNHYHLVLHVDKARTNSWTDDEVIRRWRKLYLGPDLLQRHLNAESLHVAEKEKLAELILIWRERLSSISRFMACLNYVIALQANREDGCTGRFWEGRFKSQALKDESAILACMAYVDLNPIRAGIAEDLPGSDFTSIQDRIQKASRKGKALKGKPALMRFAGNASENKTQQGIPFIYRDYLELVDWYGRHQHPRKKGIIKESVPKLLFAIGLSEHQWRLLSQEIQKEASSMLSGLEKLEVLEKSDSRKKAA